jgi:hypothetical protein
VRKERNIDRTTVEKRAAQEEAAARIAAARQPKKMTNVRRLKWRRKLREEAFPGPDWLKPS